MKHDKHQEFKDAALAKFNKENATNLRFIGGWDENDFYEYALKITDEALRLQFEWMMQEIEPNKNYPVDIFQPVSQKDLNTIHAWLQQNMGFPLDRLAAHIARRTLEGCSSRLGDRDREASP